MAARRFREEIKDMIKPHLAAETSRRLIFNGVLLAAAGFFLWRGAAMMDYPWRWSRLPRYFFHKEGGEWTAGPLLEGLALTLQLSAAAGLAAAVLGLLAAAMAAAKMPSLRLLARCYVNAMRGTPLLVQLYVLYFVVGGALEFSRFFAGVAALALFEGAFAAEIFRSGIAAVPRGQSESAAALGMGKFARWRLVILPQALPLILPSLANLLVSLIKHSSIVTVIAVADLTDAARNLISETFLTFELWLTVGAIYIAVCLPSARLIAAWETRLRRRRTR